jgi:hypothetical protein
MTLTIDLPDEQTVALAAKAGARGLSAEQYARQVLEHDLVPGGFRSHGEAQRNPAWISFPGMRSTRRSRRRGGRGVDPRLA